MKLHFRKTQSVSNLDFGGISSKAGSVSLTITLVELWRQNGTFTFLVISNRLVNIVAFLKINFIDSPLRIPASIQHTVFHNEIYYVEYGNFYLVYFMLVVYGRL